MSEVGKAYTRVDALAKVTGTAIFPGDIKLKDQLYMKLLFSEHAHAVIKSIDLSKAKKIPGVVEIFTASDVPNNEYGLIIPDQPVLCGPGSNKPFADHVRFLGDQIAAVVAESEEIAEKAKKLIHVDYEVLPHISDPRVAKENSKLLIHPERESNVFCHDRIRHGDINKGLALADVIVEGVYQTPAQEHAFLQPEAGVAYIDEEDRVTFEVSGQWVHEEAEQVAHALNLPMDKVRCIHPAIGGAFGGREDISVQIVLALAAYRLNQKGIQRPVKIIWSREESIRGHHKRHPFYVKTKWGATKDGKIVAAEVEMIQDGGAYAYTSTKVLGNATMMCTGPYEIENVAVDTYSVYTNNIPNGAFRGFGGPQGAFVAEQQVNKLAEALGLDPITIRLKNCFQEGSILSVGSPIPKGVSIDKVIRTCAHAAGWKQVGDGWTNELLKKEVDEPIKLGLGFACAYKNVGFSFGAPEQCFAIIELHGTEKIEKVILRHAGAEVGQGSHTVFRQMAADAVGVPVNLVELVAADTATSKNSGSVSASRMTFMSGNSIIGAGKAALEKWKNEERPAIAEYEFNPPKTTPYDPETGECNPNFSYGYVAESVELEVNTDTGQIEIKNVIVADDVGKAINPKLVVGQIEGCVVQATGYVILENLIQQDCVPLTDKLSTYLIPTVLDIPNTVQSVLVEEPDPIGPWGARGMAEMPYLPYAPAITNAVYQATGVWHDEFPLTPERIVFNGRSQK
jgi:CO/xanthine dehydrogenase Mo-binding subunit